jgi:cytochrome b6-f complex iron-sulfur subunit
MNSDISKPSSNGDSMNRKTFLRVAAGGVGFCYAAALGYPVYRYLASPVEKAAGMTVVSEVTLPEAKKLALGSALMFRFGPRISMLIHHKDDSWVAMEAVCTHLGCTVQYESAKDRIYCACHGGTYNSHTGANIAGPPPKPLPQLVVKVTADAVVVTRPQKNT